MGFMRVNILHPHQPFRPVFRAPPRKYREFLIHIRLYCSACGVNGTEVLGARILSSRVSTGT